MNGGISCMKVLILGGTGAMGKPLTQLIANQNNSVFVTTRTHRTSENPQIHYICGNTHDLSFTKSVLINNHFDVIVDFMSYEVEEFRERMNLLLTSTEHYFFLSSCRVYADSKKKLLEGSPRLLDVSKDEEFLETEEYALTKSREENLIFTSTYKNWTILRPYITYNDNRLQLASLEKEIWLKRAIQGQSIPLPNDVGKCLTTLTYGEDVAKIIAFLSINRKGMGEIVQVVGNETMTWEDVLQIYTKVLNRYGITPKVWRPDTSDMLQEIMNNKYQVRYDRKYNRAFDNTKMLEMIDNNFNITEMSSGLSTCLERFLMNPVFDQVDGAVVAKIDKACKEFTPLSCIKGIKQKVKYILWRYFTGLIIVMKKVRSTKWFG